MCLEGGCHGIRMLRSVDGHIEDKSIRYVDVGKFWGMGEMDVVVASEGVSDDQSAHSDVTVAWISYSCLLSVSPCRSTSRRTTKPCCL